jgi:hypothetical protein
MDSEIQTYLPKYINEFPRIFDFPINELKAEALMGSYAQISLRDEVAENATLRDCRSSVTRRAFPRTNHVHTAERALHECIGLQSPIESG